MFGLVVPEPNNALCTSAYLMYEDEIRMGSRSVFVVSALCLPELLLEEASKGICVEPVQMQHGQPKFRRP